MNVLIIADLHWDFWRDAGRDPLAGLDPDLLASLDALIIAGDLTNKPKVRWKHALRDLARRVPAARIHVIPGNHDYYDHVLDGDDRLRRIAEAEGVRFAQETVLRIGTARFLCCTLWTDFALRGPPEWGMAAAREHMNDYRFIRLAGREYSRIGPSDVAGIHWRHRGWLHEQFEQPFDGPTYVVTHHAPVPQALADPYASLAPCYASDLRDLIREGQPAGWFFGHTHEPCDVMIGQTRVVNLSIGYPPDEPDGSDPVRAIAARIHAGWIAC